MKSSVIFFIENELIVKIECLGKLTPAKLPLKEKVNIIIRISSSYSIFSSYSISMELKLKTCATESLPCKYV